MSDGRRVHGGPAAAARALRGHGSSRGGARRAEIPQMLTWRGHREGQWTLTSEGRSDITRMWPGSYSVTKKSFLYAVGQTCIRVDTREANTAQVHHKATELVASACKDTLF